MRNTKLKLLISVIILFNGALIYCQAEYPKVFIDYVKINESSKKIKDAKIRKCTEIKTANNRQDTMKTLYYDDNGNLLQKYLLAEASNFSDGDYGYISYFYLYNNGILVQKIDSSNGEALKTIISYDEFGNISKEEIKAHNEIIREISYEYDNLSRLIESVEKDLVQNCKTTQRYDYDSYNNLAKLSVKSSCSGIGSNLNATTCSYKYDSKYNIIEKRTTYPTGSYKIESFKYEKGSLIESYASSNKEAYIKYVYFNDAASNSIKVEETEVIREIFTKYTRLLKYDKYGNLLEEQYTGPDGKEIYTRKNIYEYY